MKKRILSMALALALALSLCVPALAAEEPEYRLASITGDDNWTFTYDDGGWLPTEVFDNNSGRTCLTISYDDAGRVVSWEDLTISNASDTRTYTYDSNGNLLESDSSYTYGDEGGGNHTVNSYDDSGNLIHSESTIVRDNETTASSTDYTYDNAGQNTSSTTYSSDGEVLIESVCSYDGSGDLLRKDVTYSDGATSAMEFTYDDAGNMLSAIYSNDGEITRETTYVYDEEGRKVSETTDNSGESSVTKYIYTPLMTIEIYEGKIYDGSSGFDLSYNFYDSEGKMILPNSSWPSNTEPQLTYDDAGYLTHAEFGNGYTADFTYEPVA